MRWSPTKSPGLELELELDGSPARKIHIFKYFSHGSQSPRHAALPPTGYCPLRTYYFASYVAGHRRGIPSRYLHRTSPHTHRCSFLPSSFAFDAYFYSLSFCSSSSSSSSPLLLLFPLAISVSQRICGFSPVSKCPLPDANVRSNEPLPIPANV